MTQSEPNSPVNTVRYRTAPSSPAVNPDGSLPAAAAGNDTHSDLFTSLFTSPLRPQTGVGAESGVVASAPTSPNSFPPGLLQFSEQRPTSIMDGTAANEMGKTPGKDLNFILPHLPKNKAVMVAGGDVVVPPTAPESFDDDEREPLQQQQQQQQQQVIEDQGVVRTKDEFFSSIHDRLVSPASPFITAPLSATPNGKKQPAVSGELDDEPLTAPLISSDEIKSDGRGNVDVDVDGNKDDNMMITSPTATPSIAQPLEPEQVDYSFAWSIATQKGYRYANYLARSSKLEIHPHMEDMHYPYSRNSPNHIHPLTGRPFQVFMLADGHGGSECATFAVNTLPPECVKIINSKAWNFDLQSDQEECRQLLQQSFLAADSEYCSHKLEQFRQWIRKILEMNGNPTDQRFKADKPTDDGCTLVVNILYEGYLINCNVGDSRTLALRKSNDQSHNSNYSWSPVFASEDHTPGHPERARMLHDNGGRFIFNGITVEQVHTVFEAEHLSEMAAQLYNLSHCRIGRKLGWKIKEIDFPALTTLNLTGTMGDLFFKHDPPLITARPDVSFFRMKPLQTESYMLVMATDGLWDHMSRQKPEEQHLMISNYVSDVMEAELEGDTQFLNNNDNNGERIDSITAEIQRKLEKLGVLAHGMADREMISGGNNLFAQGYLRYDDVTVFIVMIEGPPPQQ